MPPRATTRRRAAVTVGPRARRDGRCTQALLERYQRTGSLELRNQLVELHMPLVRRLAIRLRKRITPNMELDDLVSAGALGLMDAIDAFDGDRGVKFETYCTIRINGAMLDDLRQRDWVPRLVRRHANRIDTARRTLAAELRREATDEELAERLEMPVHRFQELVRETAQPTVQVSLDVVRFEDHESDGQPRLGALADRKADDPVEHASRGDILDVAFRGLSRREKVIMALYYRRGFTMRRIGGIYGMSESRVCQIHTGILRRIRERLQSGTLGR